MDFTSRTYDNCTQGIRSKLKVAIAMVGGLPIAILDEPTKGVDPLSQRHIWNIIGIQARKAILVSSMK